MQVFLNIPDALMLSLAKRAEKQECTIEELILSCCGFDVEPARLGDTEIQSVLVALFQYAVYKMAEVIEPFTLKDLCDRAGKQWLAIAPADRKTLGKRFAKMIETETDIGRKVVTAGKTITNSTLYLVCDVQN